MKRIDGISYPDSIDDILKHRKLSKVFFSHLVDEQSTENALFWLAPRKPEVLFKNFLRRGARHQINVSGDTLDDAQDLADANTWDLPAWKETIDTARGECATMMAYGPLTRFWTSEPFEKYHKAHAGILLEEADGKDAKARQGSKTVQLDLKKLGLCGFENMRSGAARVRIQDLILASKAKDSQEAAKILIEIRKKEPKTSFIQTVSVKDLMKTLTKKKAYKVVKA